MLRRFNYTDRRRIERSDVQVSLGRPDAQGVQEFDVSLKLDRLSLPDAAAVSVEAYYRQAYQRFDFGTVARLTRPADRRLTQLAFTDSPYFRVKVTDVGGSRGRILAMAKEIKPESPAGRDRESLLPVNFVTMEDGAVWRLSFETGNGPILEVNRDIPDIRETVRSRGWFGALVWPAVVRRILMQVVFVETVELSVGSDWAGRWLAFAAQFFRQPPPDDRDSAEDRVAWIEGAVSAFTRHIRPDRLLALEGTEA